MAAGLPDTQSGNVICCMLAMKQKERRMYGSISEKEKKVDNVVWAGRPNVYGILTRASLRQRMKCQCQRTVVGINSMMRKPTRPIGGSD